MPGPIYLLGFLAAATSSYARVHHLIVGNLMLPASLYVLEFDDESLDFRITSNNTAVSSHAWITFGRSKEIVYGASLDSTSTAQYEVLTASNSSAVQGLRHVGSAENCSGGSGGNGTTTSAYVIASTHGHKPPFDVYGAAWPGPGACGTAFAASPERVAAAGSWVYAEDSAVHGLAIGGLYGSVLYSADLGANSIWTHSIDGGFLGKRGSGDGVRDDGGGEEERRSSGAGRVDLVARLVVARNDSGPRHLLAHPAEKYLHVLMETSNQLVTYDLDDNTREPVNEVSMHSLIPEGLNNSAYWSAEVSLSPNGRYLWGSARARPGSDDVGYLTAFLLSADGAVERPMFTVPTTTRGGIANSVAPAPWSDRVVAMTDFGTGYVQIWNMQRNNATTLAGDRQWGDDDDDDDDDPDLGFDTAEPIARVDIADGGCCANVIWFD